MPPSDPFTPPKVTPIDPDRSTLSPETPPEPWTRVWPEGWVEVWNMMSWLALGSLVMVWAVAGVVWLCSAPPTTTEPAASTVTSTYQRAWASRRVPASAVSASAPSISAMITTL